ncbi:MAG: hypothetical protein CVV52_07940 [Spirochaetae bacterium HGW-Spirochaetae-8]|nr:MAG: hypothetical protein CVV52_07940 [Spirochaetae bacterium HGW-Spirochaetae-8]
MRDDRGTLAKVNKFIKDIERNPFDELEKPVPHIGELPRCCSRGIDEKERLSTPSPMIPSCSSHAAPTVFQVLGKPNLFLTQKHRPHANCSECNPLIHFCVFHPSDLWNCHYSIGCKRKSHSA